MQIEEQVLPERYQHHITKEINRILRDLEKPTESEHLADQARQSSIWRRETDSRTESEMRSELDRIRLELERTTEHAREVESKCEGFENLARTAESRYREAVRTLRELQEKHKSELESLRAAQAHHDEDTGKTELVDVEKQLEKEHHADVTSPATRDALVSRILEGIPIYFCFWSHISRLTFI